MALDTILLRIYGAVAVLFAAWALIEVKSLAVGIWLQARPVRGAGRSSLHCQPPIPSRLDLPPCPHPHAYWHTPSRMHATHSSRLQTGYGGAISKDGSVTGTLEGADGPILTAAAATSKRELQRTVLPLST
jgi:hypothetical protein